MTVPPIRSSDTPPLPPLPRAVTNALGCSVNTATAYAQDWAHFLRWCRMQGADPLPPSPRLLGQYIANLGAQPPAGSGLALVSIKRRLSGLGWAYAKRGHVLDRNDSQISTAIATLHGETAPAARQKRGISQTERQAMIATLPNDLRGLRDRAILLIGMAAPLRRSELTGLWLSDKNATGRNCIERADEGLTLHLHRKTGLLELQIARIPTATTCPVEALEQWLHYARIKSGPIFVAVSRDGRRAMSTPLNDKHIPRLIKHTILASGIRNDLTDAERNLLYAGLSLRARPEDRQSTLRDVALP